MRLTDYPDDASRAAVRDAARRQLGVPAETMVIGFVGRLVPEKGIDELLEAFETLAREQSPVLLLVVGGTLASERNTAYWAGVMERIQRQPELRDRLITVGFQKEVGPFLASMDVLVLPSHREGFGMVVAEAAAYAVPSIATRTRGGRESIVDGETGVLVDIRSRAGILAALRSLLLDPQLRRTLGRRARERAVERFDEAVVTRRILAVYSSLLKGADDR